MKLRIMKEFAAHPNQEKRSPIFDEVIPILLFLIYNIVF